MVVQRSVAVALLQALGFKTADNWDDQRMVKKLSMLHELVEDDMAIGEPDLDNVLDDLIYAGRENKEIELGEPGEAEPATLEEVEESSGSSSVSSASSESESSESSQSKKKRRPRKLEGEKTSKARGKRTVNHLKTRAGIGATLLKRHGLDADLDSMVDEADRQYVESTGHKSNRNCAATYLGIARCAIKSWLEV